MEFAGVRASIRDSAGWRGTVPYPRVTDGGGGGALATENYLVAVPETGKRSKSKLLAPRFSINDFPVEFFLISTVSFKLLDIFSEVTNVKIVTVIPSSMSLAGA